MAGNLPVPQGLEVRLVWNLGGNPYAVNILHFTHAVGTLHSQARADSIATVVRNSFTNNFAVQVHPSVTLARIESRHMDANSDPWFIGAGAATPGTGTGKPLPAATSFAITLKTGLRGRSYNGRVFLWGYVEGANDAAGGMTSAAGAASVAFVDGIRQNMNTTLTAPMGVLSRWTTPPTAPPGTPPTERTPPIITAVTLVTNLDLRWDVQRRRAVPGI